VHVPLRRPEILMTREFLNRSCQRATHRQMRAERVPEDVHALAMVPIIVKEGTDALRDDPCCA